MRAYYSHCTAIYNTPQEDRDIFLLESIGFEVINPNSPEVNRRCDEIRERFKSGQLQGFWDKERGQQPRLSHFIDAGQAVMELIFKPMLSAAKSDLVAFRALPDGRIPAGVAREIAWGQENGLFVIELPSNLMDRGMSVASTRAYLHEIGSR